MTKQTIPDAKQWVIQDDIDAVCKILSSDFIEIDPASLCLSPDKLETYSSRTLSLLLYPAMTDTQVQKVIETV